MNRRAVPTSLAVCGLLLIDAPQSVKGDPPVDRTKPADGVRCILPQGWVVTNTVKGSTPPDWISNDPKAGVLVEGGNGDKRFQIWFLPRDWIGIRKRSARAPRTTYWQGILAESDYITISYTTHEPLYERFRDVFQSSSWTTPALCNGGFRSSLQVFKGKCNANAAEGTAAGLSGEPGA
jgi:hypothetical protein